MKFAEMFLALKQKSKDVVNSTTNDAVEAFSGVAIRTIDRVTETVTNEATKAVNDVHAVATLAVVNATEAAINASANAIDGVGDQFADVLDSFMNKLTEIKEEDYEEELTPTKKLGIEIATALHKRLDSFRKAFVEQKTLSVEEFQAECKRSVNEARPKLEEHLDHAFVKMLLAPLVDFLNKIGLSFISNFFKPKSEIVKNDFERPENSPTISPRGHHN